MNNRKFEVGVESLGVFLLGMTFVAFISLFLKSDAWATATAICYATGVIVVPIYKAKL